LDALDARQGEADDAVYGALADLRGAVVRDIAARGADLARVVRYTPPETLPALVLAHRLYGDAARDGELVARNGIAHPGFVPGGLELEVLTA
jgi:prophage DNA circulation protein